MPNVSHGPDRPTGHRPDATTPEHAEDWHTQYPLLAAELDNLDQLNALADQLHLPKPVAA